MRPDLSQTDEAFRVFRDSAQSELKRFLDADLSESDTRSKLIDPLLKDVLGWHEADITREEPADEGFADYLIGADFPYFHIEAKRIRPRLRIAAPSRNRVLKLSGAHLLGQKEVRSFIEQAARYAADLGTDFALLTNGEQFVVFKTHLHGRSWRDGIALVWHDLRDIEEHFAEFFNLLSRERVRAGSLIEAFENAESITTTLYTPLQFVFNADAELVRNRFWNEISRWLGPLLVDQPENVPVQEEIIRHCYVRTRLSDQTDDSLDRLLRDEPSRILKGAGAVDLQPGMRGKTAFDYSVENDIKLARSGTYVLTGGVGTGKTTFLRRFARVVAAPLVREYCIWLHIDFLSAGNIDRATLERDLRQFAFQRMRETLETEYRADCPQDGGALRELFKSEIENARMTRLFGFDERSPDYHREVNAIVELLYKDHEQYVRSLFARHARRGRRIVIVFDNTDQLGEEFQAAVFLLSQGIARDCQALAIVALREEKFFAAYRRGIFDAFGDRRFHIGSPDLEMVIRKRLVYGLRKYKDQITSEAGAGNLSEEQKQVEAILWALIRSTTQKNQNIIRMLACVSNGDTRHALGMFRDFVSSGNTDMDKIIEILRRTGSYTVPFHEFAKSAVLGLRRYFKSSVSHILNVFLRSAARGSSHLTASRILARLSSAERTPSPHGEGFIDTVQLLGEYRQSFGLAEDFLQRGEELLRRGLLESEPPKAAGIERTDALRVSASGAYYWRYLARAFAYVDLVYVDTPIEDRELALRLSKLSTLTDYASRFDRVRAFLDYLQANERSELLSVAERGGPYAAALIPQSRAQIESEIEFIKRRTGA